VDDAFLAKYPKTAQIKPKYDKEFAEPTIKNSEKEYYNPKHN